MTRNSFTLFDPKLVKPAVRDSFLKLDPRVQWRNPVMFVVYVGSIITSVLFVQALTGKGVPVSSIMSKTSLKASPNENIITAVDRMTKANVRHLPVVDKEGKPLGMISMRDAMSISEPLLKFVLHSTRKAKHIEETGEPTETPD